MGEKRVLPIYANPNDVVEIHWRLPQGEALIERHTVPPASTRQARIAAEADVRDTTPIDGIGAWR